VNEGFWPKQETARIENKIKNLRSIVVEDEEQRRRGRLTDFCHRSMAGGAAGHRLIYGLDPLI
jgi:hypothetical protein